MLLIHLMRFSVWAWQWSKGMLVYSCSCWAISGIVFGFLLTSLWSEASWMAMFCSIHLAKGLCFNCSIEPFSLIPLFIAC